MPLPFEIAVDGPPISQHNRGPSKVLWRQKVKKAAKQIWGTETPYIGKVMVTITYFFHGASLDVDNMPKPILDEFNDLIYFDDSQVTDLICRKRDLNEDLPMPNPSPQLFKALLDFEQPVQINVVNSLNQEVIT